MMQSSRSAGIGLPVVSDGFGRRISYLRISLTDRCNLRCVYCMPEFGVPYDLREDLLSLPEIMRVVRLLAENGLTKVRLTGGEPLVRGRDIVSLIEQIASLPQIVDIGLTTNGVLLAPLANDLYAVGLKRINISLDTLQRDRFIKIARADQFDNAVAGLRAARAAGFAPIKLNMVVMRGINDDEILDFARLTIKDDYQVRFLEYMPIGQVTPYEWRTKYISNEDVMDRVRASFDLEEVSVDATSTSRVWRVVGASGTIGVISPISHKFCEGCNRLRLTANGSLVPCLSDNFEYDLRTPLRCGEPDSAILQHVRNAVAQKPLQSDFEGRAERGGSLRIMAQIGG
jgi:GTP 3',8-cyclase